MPAYMELAESAVFSFFGAMMLLASIPVSMTLGVFGVFRSLFAKRAIEPRTIVITGSSSGIGDRLALEYSKIGNNVILIGRNVERLREVEKACVERGANARVISIDVTVKEEMNKLFRDLDEDFGGLDLVICNAGVTADAHKKSVGRLGIDGAAKMIVEKNVLGVFYTLAPVIEVMQKRCKGHIVITGSLLGVYGNPSFAIYSASKALLQSLARDLYPSLQKKNIKLSLVAPAPVGTPLTDIARDEFGSWSSDASSAMSALYIKHRIAAGTYFIAFPKFMEFVSFCASVIPPPMQPYVSYAFGLSGMMGRPGPDVLCLS